MNQYHIDNDDRPIRGLSSFDNEKLAFEKEKALTLAKKEKLASGIN